MFPVCITFVLSPYNDVLLDLQSFLALLFKNFICLFLSGQTFLLDNCLVNRDKTNLPIPITIQIHSTSKGVVIPLSIGSEFVSGNSKKAENLGPNSIEKNPTEKPTEKPTEIQF